MTHSQHQQQQPLYGIIQQKHRIATWWGIISGTPVTFCRNSGNECPKLMITAMQICVML